MQRYWPQTLLEAVRFFADTNTCHEYMLTIKWPDGRIVCPKCESDRIGQINTRRLLRCKACRKQFSAKVGTIFEDSPIGLDKWFVAVWCIATKNGISSCELGRALGVQQKTAWFMLHRVRLAMRAKGTRMADEKKKPTMGALARKLIQVPKRELKKQVRLYKGQRRRSRRRWE